MEKEVLVVFHLVIKYKKLSHNSDSLCSFFFFSQWDVQERKTGARKCIPCLERGEFSLCFETGRNTIKWADSEALGSLV